MSPLAADSCHHLIAITEMVAVELSRLGIRCVLSSQKASLRLAGRFDDGVDGDVNNNKVWNITRSRVSDTIMTRDMVHLVPAESTV